MNILQSTGSLTRGMDALRSRCIEGIEADAERCRSLHDSSLVHAAALNPLVGYAKAASLARTALAERVSLREVVGRDSGLSAAQIDTIFGEPRRH